MALIEPWRVPSGPRTRTVPVTGWAVLPVLRTGSTIAPLDTFAAATG